MKFLFFLTFALSSLKAGIWVIAGILLRNHFEAIVSLIVRKPIPENLVDNMEKEKFRGVLNILGGLLIIIGLVLVVIAFSTWLTSMKYQGNNINFNFK